MKTILSGAGEIRTPVQTKCSRAFYMLSLYFKFSSHSWYKGDLLSAYLLKIRIVSEDLYVSILKVLWYATSLIYQESRELHKSLLIPWIRQLRRNFFRHLKLWSSFINGVNDQFSGMLTNQRSFLSIPFGPIFQWTCLITSSKTNSFLFIPSLFFHEGLQSCFNLMITVFLGLPDKFSTRQ